MKHGNIMQNMAHRQMSRSEPVEGIKYASNREGNPVMKHQFTGDVGTTTNGGETKMKSKLTTWGN